MSRLTFHSRQHLLHQREFTTSTRRYFKWTKFSYSIIYDFKVYDDRRTSILPDRGEGLIVAQDYLRQRINEEEFQLCKECPAPQNKNGVTNYKILCEKHQKKK